MTEITVENATRVAAALLAELDADDHAAEEEAARKKEETRRKRAELQQMIEQSEAYQEKKRLEEARKAAVEAQESAFTQHIQQNVDELKSAAEAYQDWQRRVDEFAAIIESRALELQREGINLSTHMDQIARSLGEQIGSFNWNHKLTHNGDLQQAFASFASRIKRIIPPA